MTVSMKIPKSHRAENIQRGALGFETIFANLINPKPRGEIVLPNFKFLEKKAHIAEYEPRYSLKLE